MSMATAASTSASVLIVLASMPALIKALPVCGSKLAFSCGFPVVILVPEGVGKLLSKKLQFVKLAV
jgi:hypothetical protein